MGIPRFAIIPTHNRPSELVNLLTQLRDQCDFIYVIDNASEPPVSDLWLQMQLPPSRARFIVSRDEAQPPHLYRMWNEAFEIIELSARAFGDSIWNVAVFNDDSDIPDGWYDYVAAPLTRTPESLKHLRIPAISCTYAAAWNLPPTHKLQPDNNIMTRMCPWAFVVRGELGLRADESMRWWWGDTDFEWQAMQHGGVMLLPGHTVKNTCANSTTVGALAEQAARDGETFAAKWGSRPW